MIDPIVRQLLEQVVDSPVKLHLLLIFHEHPRIEISAQQMAERACRDIWSVTEALKELAQDGAVACLNVAGGEARYRYSPGPDRVEPIRRLLRGYDDPITRDLIQRVIRENSPYASFRRAAAYEAYASV